MSDITQSYLERFMRSKPFERRSIGPQEIDKAEPSIENFRSEYTKGAAITHPFQLIDDTEVGVDANLKVRYGTVNDVVPTLSATSLSSAPSINLASNGTYLVYLEVTYDDDGVISGITVEVDLAGTLPAYTDNIDYITLGEVDVETVGGFKVVSELRQAVTHSLRHAICGRTFDESEVIDEPGDPYFWGV